MICVLLNKGFVELFSFSLIQVKTLKELLGFICVSIYIRCILCCKLSLIWYMER